MSKVHSLLSSLSVLAMMACSAIVLAFATVPASAFEPTLDVRASLDLDRVALTIATNAPVRSALSEFSAGVRQHDLWLGSGFTHGRVEPLV